jgi:RNA polymerase sigma factor (sigma-70 family)
MTLSWGRGKFEPAPDFEDNMPNKKLVRNVGPMNLTPEQWAKVFEILQQIGPGLCNKARLPKGSADAEDFLSGFIRPAVQRAVLRFTPNRGTVEGFAYACALNALIDYWRMKACEPKEHQFKEGEGGDGEMHEYEFPAPSEHEPENDLSMLIEAMAQLPEKYRVTADGMLTDETIRACSKRTGIKESTLRWRRYRIIERLQRELVGSAT